MIALIVVLGAAWFVREHYTTRSETLTKYMDGVNLMQSGHPTQAVAVWEDLVREDPNFADTYIQLANYYTQQDDAPNAVSLLQQLQERHIDSPEARIALAEAYTKLKDKRALAAAKRAVSVAPNSARAHLALSTAYAQAFDPPHTLQELRTAERLDPTNRDQYLLGAEYCLSASDYPGVEEQARQCIAALPNTAEAWYLLGRSLAARPSPAHTREAISALQRSVALNPRVFNAWMELGSVLLQTHQTAEATRDLEEARTLSASVVPEDQILQQHLQDRIRIAHLLLSIYQPAGNTVKAAQMRKESDQLAGQLQRLTHPSAKP